LIRGTRIVYAPIMPAKYVGSLPIVLKSTWEEDFAKRVCDMNESCLQWAYEPHKIPYRDPISGEQKLYVPDFLMSFISSDGHPKIMLVEVKPRHEAYESAQRNKMDAVIRIKNVAKWTAAAAWCIRRGIEFKVITEAELYGVGGNRTNSLRRPSGAGKTKKVKVKRK